MVATETYRRGAEAQRIFRDGEDRLGFFTIAAQGLIAAYGQEEHESHKTELLAAFHYFFAPPRLCGVVLNFINSL